MIVVDRLEPNRPALNWWSYGTSREAVEMFYEEVPGREDDINVGSEAFGGQVCFGRQHRHPHKLCRMATIEHCMHISNEWSHGDNRTWHAKTPRPQSSFVLRVQSSPWVSPWSLHHAGKTTPSVPWCDGEGCWPIVPDELGIVCCYLVSAAPLRRSAIVWVPPGRCGAIVIVGALLGLGTPSRPRGVGQSSQLIVASCVSLVLAPNHRASLVVVPIGRRTPHRQCL